MEPHHTGESGFDCSHFCREIGVAFGQGPDAMHVVGQDDPGVDGEGALHPGHADGVAEGFDLAGQDIGATGGEGDGEEDGGAGAAGKEVGRHLGRAPEGG